ncbi:MAG: HD domain-containing protein [Bacteroidales bacterium]|nr:HD domain-containing protein [Bacteroidales bacterium]HOY40135.1 HD domain-containing protein [Bacteroidales bacterium]HQP04513.1 HD domain-containing protein [Bacteroidales bacterium]
MKNPLPEQVYSARVIPREADIRGDYFRDQTAIIHSTAFRRLKSKTQVFYAPDNDHICTRIEHVLHVATISAAICKGLNMHGWELNSEMAYAIGLGHDLGHTPFGHAGEKAINTYLGGGTSFAHEINSYRIVAHTANHGNGLNLTFGVRDGIICHNGERDEQHISPDPSIKDLDLIKDRNVLPSSYEGCIVRLADKIAYLGRDLEDAVLAGIISEKIIPEKIKSQLGTRNGKIINDLVIDLIEASKNSDTIGFSDEKYDLMQSLKEFNYKAIYFHSSLQAYEKFCDKVIRQLYEHFEELFDKLQVNYSDYQNQVCNIDRQFGEYLQGMEVFYNNGENSGKQRITDFISGMTDTYCIDAARQINIPEPIVFLKKPKCNY